GRRGLELDVEGAILVHRHQAADDLALHVGAHRVELLDELPGVHAVLTERGPDGRRGRRGPAGRLKLELARDLFFRHDSYPFACVIAAGGSPRAYPVTRQ